MVKPFQEAAPHPRGRVKRAVVAGLAAAAMLSTPAVAFAGGGQGNRPADGVGGNLPMYLFWQYKDDASGSFGPATNIDSVKAAFDAAGVTLKDSGKTKAQAALNDALTMCKTGFQHRHPGEGDGDCRVVAVGAAVTNQGGKWVYDGNGYYMDHKNWQDVWDQYISPHMYSYAGTQSYHTKDGFDDDPSNSVDKMMKDATPNNQKTSVAIIVLDKYQPKPPETPPNPPTKTITPGTSADNMTNTTQITTGTGVGGKTMVIQDAINPNNMAYKITGQKITDKTTGQDVTSQFTFNTPDGQAAPNNTATATWNGGKLPEKHDFVYELTITVSQPDTSKVADKPSVTWNGKSTGDVAGHEFPTWKPNPDKSWIKMADGKWQAVIDPDETNSTGADKNVFLDGDTVGSAVNATVDPDLAQAPSNFQITDDWTAADYLVDAQDASKVKVYAKAADADQTETVDGKTVHHYTKTSVADIANTGEDVTSMFDIKMEGTKATATAKPEYLAKLKGMEKGLQVTLLVPFTVDFANGKGAEQVRKDFGKQPGDELTFCETPGTDDQPGAKLTNKGAETVNGQTEPTNEPYICGYLPPVKKDVIGEGSEGGDQESVDGKVVYPGQKVEYQLTTQPQLPADLAYTVKKIVFTDTYDQYLTPDEQTVEMMDLTTGKVVSKKKYTTKWDESKHLFQLTVTDKEQIAKWRAGANPRVQIRFEGTVAKDAPTDHKVNNQWMLTLNNSLTPSNEVFNTPPEFTPHKQDNQSKEQGDPTISIDGKTMLLGDTGNYAIDIDATQKNQAYKVWRLGVVDDYDDEYLTVDPSKIEVLGADGKDYTSQFNIQLKDGVVYAFAKTVDTPVDATGETVKGDPQPTDLKAYSEISEKDHDPLKDPAIDQKLLGQTYQLIIPYKVSKVTDGYVVKNTATQLVNDVRKKTNEVTNPLKPINPVKDVTVKVNGDSVDGKSIYLNSTFLYQLDSSVIPANRAYDTVSQWGIDDQLDPTYDQLTGQWAVYASRDLYQNGKLLAKKGERIAGSGFDSSKLGGDLFTGTLDKTTGKVTIEATDLYKKLVSSDNQHEQAWRAYIQCTRVKVTERHENQFTERFNDKTLTSNIVWTRTPDLTPSIKLEKWDKASGWPNGDRDQASQALNGAKDGDTIVFTITNTSKDDDGHGAWFKASDLKLEDHTIVGDGTVVDLKYPDNWNTLVLKPGQSVNVEGTLKGFTQTTHTDRASVTGKPLVECPVVDEHPFDDQSDADKTDTDKTGKVTVDGQTRCEATSVTSNTDDWNGKQTPLAATGITAMPVLLVMGAASILLAGLTVIRKARERVA